MVILTDSSTAGYEKFALQSIGGSYNLGIVESRNELSFKRPPGISLDLEGNTGIASS